MGFTDDLLAAGRRYFSAILRNPHQAGAAYRIRAINVLLIRAIIARINPSNYCAFMQTLHDIILQCVPIKKKNRSRRPTKKPLPRALKLYTAKKHRLWRKLSACPYDLCVRNKYIVVAGGINYFVIGKSPSRVI